MTREQFIANVEATQKAFRRFFVALCCGNTMLADDIAQESYIKAYLCCDTLTNPEKFRAWIFKIGYTTLLNHKRGERLTVGVGYENIAEEPVAPDSADSTFAYQRLYLALSRIPTKERNAVLLHYMQGYSVKEIAEIQETTSDAVKQQLSRGRFHLRNLLSNE